MSIEQIENRDIYVRRDDGKRSLFKRRSKAMFRIDDALDVAVIKHDPETPDWCWKLVETRYGTSLVRIGRVDPTTFRSSIDKMYDRLSSLVARIDEEAKEKGIEEIDPPFQAMSCQTELMRQTNDRYVTAYRRDNGKWSGIEYVVHPTPSGCKRYLPTYSDNREFDDSKTAKEEFEKILHDPVKLDKS